MQYTITANDHNSITVWFTVSALDYTGACSVAIETWKFETGFLREDRIVKMEVVNLSYGQ